MSQTFEAAGDIHLTLTEQIVRLQALLEASRSVHSTIDLSDVLHQSAQIVVRELEMEGAAFTSPHTVFGEVPEGAIETPCESCPRFSLLARDGQLLSELVVATPEGRALSLYERDFLEGLVLQTSIAVENAINHRRHIEYARLAQDLDAARGFSRVCCRSRCHPFRAILWLRARRPATTLAGTISTSSRNPMAHT